MTHPVLSTRQRLIQSALELFATQGISATTTRKIAERAEVNEVTLFRQFGNKYGLLLAVLEESDVFSQLGASLVPAKGTNQGVDQMLKEYASLYLHAVERVPDLIRSVVGEADQYPVENRLALGKGLGEVNQLVAQSLASILGPESLKTGLSAEKLASLLNGLLLGYAVLELTSEFHTLWVDQEDFLDSLVQLFVQGAIAAPEKLAKREPTREVQDLSAGLVHDILRQARKSGVQEGALAYVLFAAGLSAQEIVQLERSHQVSDTHQHILTVGSRQVPVNQWVMGKRYGSYVANPLVKWLKSRKDGQVALFLNEKGEPITESEITTRWQEWVKSILPAGSSHLPHLEQAQQTWCIDMLLRGVSVENLCILTGWDLSQWQPYVGKAKKISAITQATRRDQRPE